MLRSTPRGRPRGAAEPSAADVATKRRRAEADAAARENHEKKAKVLEDAMLGGAQTEVWEDPTNKSKHPVVLFNGKWVFAQDPSWKFC